jgi:hypothetical protein
MPPVDEQQYSRCRVVVLSRERERGRHVRAGAVRVPTARCCYSREAAATRGAAKEHASEVRPRSECAATACESGVTGSAHRCGASHLTVALVPSRTAGPCERPPMCKALIFAMEGNRVAVAGRSAAAGGSRAEAGRLLGVSVTSTGLSSSATGRTTALWDVCESTHGQRGAVSWSAQDLDRASSR